MSLSVYIVMYYVFLTGNHVGNSWEDLPTKQHIKSIGKKNLDYVVHLLMHMFKNTYKNTYSQQ